MRIGTRRCGDSGGDEERDAVTEETETESKEEGNGGKRGRRRWRVDVLAAVEADWAEDDGEEMVWLGGVDWDADVGEVAEGAVIWDPASSEDEEVGVEIVVIIPECPTAVALSD